MGLPMSHGTRAEAMAYEICKCGHARGCHVGLEGPCRSCCKELGLHCGFYQKAEVVDLYSQGAQVTAILEYVSGPDGRFNLYFEGEKEKNWLYFASPSTEFRLRVAKAS